MHNGGALPFGNPSTEQGLQPIVSVDAEADELIIRIPGRQLMALQQVPTKGATSPRQKAPIDENIIVLIEETTAGSNGYPSYVWFCDWSKFDEAVTEHQLLMLAIVGAMENENSTNDKLTPGMLRQFGGCSATSTALHATLPCFVDCRVRLIESDTNE